LPVWKLRNDLDSTKKFRHRSHLFLSHLKQPLFWWIICPSSTVLKRDGANNSFRFFDRRKDGMIELREKRSFNLGLDCRMNKCFLIMLPTSGRFGLNVIKNGNNFFVSFPRVFTYWILLTILSMGLLRQMSIPNLQTATYIFHLLAAILDMFSRLFLLE